MNNVPKIAILVVLYNQEQKIYNLINSIKKQTYSNYRLYLINNGENTKPVSIFLENFPDSVLLPNIGNVGFGKGNNLLAEKAINDGFDYLYVLNPDMELNYDTIEKLVKICVDDNSIGMCNCTILYGCKDKELQKIQLFGCKANYKTQSKVFLFSRKYLTDIILHDILEVEYINAGSLFIMSDVAKKVGLFDEDFFMYNEELDLAKRVKAAGYKIVVTSRTKIWHHHNWDKNNLNGYNIMYYYMTRNRYLYFYKYKLYFYLIFDLLLQILSFPVKLKMFFKLGSVKILKYYYLGLIRGLLKEKGKTNICFEP